MLEPNKHETLSLVTQRRELAPGLFTIRFRNRQVAQKTQAGQFVNVLPRAGENDPMLRRPFSVYQIEGDEAEIIVQMHGRGTTLIAETREGQYLDVIGPLGNPWKFDSENYETAVLVIGGVGVASMPLLTKALAHAKMPIETYYGARTNALFAREGLQQLHLATDDGSEGFHGTNLQLVEHDLGAGKLVRPKLFVCGPTGMMRAAKELAARFNIPCELSLETEMACGIGICQGCPVLTDETTFQSTGKRFRLVCMEGPSFEKEDILL